MSFATNAFKIVLPIALGSVPTVGRPLETTTLCEYTFNIVRFTFGHKSPRNLFYTFSKFLKPRSRLVHYFLSLFSFLETRFSGFGDISIRLNLDLDLFQLGVLRRFERARKLLSGVSAKGSLSFPVKHEMSYAGWPSQSLTHVWGMCWRVLLDLFPLPFFTLQILKPQGRCGGLDARLFDCNDGDGDERCGWPLS